MMMAESLEDENYIVYFQCSDCRLVFTKEAFHKSHICSAKPVSISILGEPMTLTPENYESLIPGSVVTAPENINRLALLEQAVLNIGERRVPILPKLGGTKIRKFTTNKREEKKKARIERERLKKEMKKTMKLKSLLVYICLKCKEGFKDIILYKEHPCSIEKLKEIEMKEKESCSDKDPVDEDKELSYQCSRCRAIFENMSAFEGHPCFWEKGNPFIVNVKENAVDNLDLVKIDQSTSEEVKNLPLEKVPNSIIVPSVEAAGPSTSKTSQRPQRENKPTPWLCSVCNKYFRQRYYLVHHSCQPPSNNPLPRGALGNPPFLCSKCGITFKHKPSYCRHIHHECKFNERPKRTIPSINKVKQYQCHVCNRYFDRKYYLVHHACDPPSNHPLPHGALGKPPYLCSGCGVVYKHKQSYCRHIHHECGKGRKFYKTYSGKYAGKSKKKKETSETHVCMLCNKECHDQEALETHVKVDHLSL